MKTQTHTHVTVTATTDDNTINFQIPKTKLEFLLEYQVSNIAAALKVNEELIAPLFRRPTHGVKTRIKTNERPGGPLDAYTGPQDSAHFLPWAIECARTKLLNKLYADSYRDLMRACRAAYRDENTVYVLIRGIENWLSFYTGSLASKDEFFQWASDLIRVSRQHREFITIYSVEIRKCLQSVVTRYGGRGLCDIFDTHNDEGGLTVLAGKFSNQIDDLENLIFVEAGARKLYDMEPGEELHQKVIQLAFEIGNRFVKTTKKDRKHVLTLYDVTDTEDHTEFGDGNKLKPGRQIIFGDSIEEERIVPKVRHLPKEVPLRRDVLDAWIKSVLFKEDRMKASDLRRAAAAVGYGKDALKSSLERLGISGKVLSLSPEMRSDMESMLENIREQELEDAETISVIPGQGNGLSGAYVEDSD